MEPNTLRNVSELADRTRRCILAAYWAVFVLALPVWWYTTSIERLSLPSTRVAIQAETELRFPIVIELDTGNSALLANQTRRKLIEMSRLAPSRWKGLDIEIQDQPSGTSTAYSVIHGSGEPTVQNRSLSFPIDNISSSSPQLADILAALLAPYSPLSDQVQHVAQYSPRYRLAFTLLNEDAAAGEAVTDWDISSAISFHIAPILDAVSVLHNFTVESQVQFHAPLAFKPRPIPGNASGITPEDLTVFINSAEWTLSSSISNDPVLHFVLFVPSATQRPLHILDTTGTPSLSNAFLLPQWGGIVIYNPPTEITSHLRLSSVQLNPIFSSFSTQLLTLLGVPNLPAGVRPAVTDSTSPPLTVWQLDALLRRRTLENVQGSQDTLLSIVKLVEQIGNMPVGQGVKDDVNGALTALDKAYSLSSTSLTLALRYSSHAVTLASRAFFNPGMLALLYFPAEHKYAVYTPLFASAVIPLIFAVLRELRAWRRNRMELIAQNRNR